MSLTGIGEPSTVRSAAHSGIELEESASNANSVLCIDATYTTFRTPVPGIVTPET